MQKRFIADAAHQMKTPLAGMRMQSELALRQTDSAEIHRSLEQLAKVRKRPRAWSTSCWHWRAPKTSRRPAPACSY
jgi:signal transduction histidine kinase